MTTDMATFTPLLMAALGLPVTPGRLDWCSHWAAGENTGAAYNPFATTLDVATLRALTNPYWNTIVLPSGGVIHVMNYRNMASGVEATARTITQSNFALILASLTQERVVPRTTNPSGTTLVGVADVIRSTWGTTPFADELDAGYIPTGWAGAAPAPTVPTLADIAAFLGDVAGWQARGNVSLIDAYALAMQRIAQLEHDLGNHFTEPPVFVAHRHGVAAGITGPVV